MDPTNPYAPPTTDLRPQSVGDLMRELDLSRARRDRLAWLVLFALNMVLPTVLATELLAPSGWLGLVAAVTALGGGGFALLAARPGWTGVAVSGAATIALTQFLPILQVMAGVCGLALVGAVPDPETKHSHLGPGPAFVVTLVTGTLLLVASMVCGLSFRVIGVIGRRGRGSTAGPLSFNRLHEPTPGA